MTPIQIRKTKLLDGERIFRMYFTDMGSARSIKKVIKQLGSDAINPTTGRVVTDMAIFWSMYRWALDNVAISYEIFNRAMLDQGDYHTLEEWKDFLLGKAELFAKHSQKGMQKWNKKLGRETL
jgi:hypothetical protein